VKYHVRNLARTDELKVFHLHKKSLFCQISFLCKVIITKIWNYQFKL